MEKVEAVHILQGYGIDAEDKDGAVYLYDIDGTMDEIRQLMKKIGYNQSWGVGTRKEKKDDVTSVC